MFHTKSNFNVAPRLLSGLMEDFFQNGWQLADEKLDRFSVPVNISETDKEYTVQVVAPGLKKEDFKINLEKDVLSISYSKAEENQTEEKTENEVKAVAPKVLRSEYSFQSFKRSFTLNDKIDTAKISARYNDGVLNISLPKKETVEPKAQEITVS